MDVIDNKTGHSCVAMETLVIDYKILWIHPHNNEGMFCCYGNIVSMICVAQQSCFYGCQLVTDNKTGHSSVAMDTLVFDYKILWIHPS